MAKITKCNLCGKTFDIWDDEQHFYMARGIGYGSKYDGDELSLDICCGCMDKLVESCKISPLITDEYMEVD